VEYRSGNAKDRDSHRLPPTSDDVFSRQKQELHSKLVAAMDLSTLGSMSEEDLRREVRRVAEEMTRQSAEMMGIRERDRLVTEVLDETFGLGPLEPLLHDPTITDILVNGPKVTYVERGGRLERTDVSFIDERHLRQVVQRIAGRVGRRVDELTPMVDARLADGSRVNAVIPPIALDGTLLSIRRFGVKALLAADLIGKKALTQEMIDFLSACVKARVNMVISGGTGSGKTTLLNAFSAFIPNDERVATIEDSAELRFQQPHVVRMETRPANIEGVGQITTRDLVRNALRMRPDRIVIGECRGSEALDMLQAMNTGHDGSLTTIHANDTRDALSRLEMMIGMAGFDLPIWIIRRQIASAVHLIIQVARLSGGVRRVVKVSEITGMEGEVISMHDLFTFNQTGVDKERRAIGQFKAEGIRPHCLKRLAASGYEVSPSLFEARVLASV
jgi:pilus assembly protein CpaF